jgi:hypothetical protein
VGRYRVSSSDNKNDDITLVTVVVVFQCAMVGISCDVVIGVGESVGAMNNIPQDNDEGRSIETIVCILNLIFDDKTHVWVFEQT